MGGSGSRERASAEARRTVRQALRDLEREIQAAKEREVLHGNRLQQAGRGGSRAAVRERARDVAAARRHTARLEQARSQMEGLEAHLSSARSLQQLVDSMEAITAALRRQSSHVATAQLRDTVATFQRQTAQLEALRDTVQDSLDDTHADAVPEDDVESLVDAVLDEYGLSVSAELAELPAAPPSGARVAQAAAAVPSD